MAKENRSWGSNRIAGALAHLGYEISDQTVGNILKRRGLLPAPDHKKTTTWKEFIRSHMDVLVATDFFTTEVWTLGGLARMFHKKAQTSCMSFGRTEQRYVKFPRSPGRWLMRSQMSSSRWRFVD